MHKTEHESRVLRVDQTIIREKCTQSLIFLFDKRLVVYVLHVSSFICVNLNLSK